MMRHHSLSTVLAAFVAISLFTGVATASSVSTSSTGNSAETLADAPFDHDTVTANNSSVSFDNGDKPIVFDTAANQTVRGETTLDPDTKLFVQIHATSQFFKSQMVAVQPDGSFNATFNFSEYEADTEFGVVVATRENNSTAGTPLAAVDGVLKNSSEATTTTALSTTSELSDMTTEAATETTTEMVAEGATETSTESTVQSSDSGGQPGFGVVVAVVALVGLVLLSRRH